jgi:hypothetical protein
MIVKHPATNQNSAQNEHQMIQKTRALLVGIAGHCARNPDALPRSVVFKTGWQQVRRNGSRS